jgi:hypothetical protein
MGSAVVGDGLQMLACFLCRVRAGFQKRCGPSLRPLRLPLISRACRLLDCD